MDQEIFDRLLRRMARGLSRRRLAGVGGALTASLTLALDAPVVGAKSKKVFMCLAGETIRIPKKKRKAWQRKGATPGKCTGACTPTCPAGRCGDDGCGGTCPPCPAGQSCSAGICRSCTVPCDVTKDSPAECGNRLRQALTEGGTIQVCPGLFEGPFALTQSTTLSGAGNGADPTVNTVLTGSNTHRIMDIQAPVTASLSRLRFTNGRALWGAGIYMYHDAANVSVTDCVLTKGNLNAGAHGGGIYAETGTMSITSCQFVDNKSSGFGAGLYVDEATVTVTGSHFTGNDAGDEGGAIYVYYENSSTTVSDCTITGNHSGGYGGGIATGFAPITITNTTISGNTAEDSGGGIYNWNGRPTITASTVSGNTAKWQGGGIYHNTGTTTITSTTIANNTASEQGGGIYQHRGSVTLATSVAITGNTAQQETPSGGGYYQNDGTFNRNDATISANTPDQCVGAGCT